MWGVSCGKIPISDFLDESGKWHRDTEHKCFVKDAPNNGSKTSISKDMFRGLFHYLLKHKELDLVNKTIDYGKAHDWVMGEGQDMSDPDVISRVVLTQNLINELYDMQSALEIVRIEESEDVIGQNTGFRARLDVLAVLFRGVLYGAINDKELELLKFQADRQPDNSAFQFAYRLYNKEHSTENAIKVLNNEQYFPKDHLPTSAERCVADLFEHDQKKGDWDPCPKEAAQHSGSDFVWAVSILDGTLSPKEE